MIKLTDLLSDLIKMNTAGLLHNFIVNYEVSLNYHSAPIVNNNPMYIYTPPDTTTTIELSIQINNAKELNDINLLTNFLQKNNIG